MIHTTGFFGGSFNPVHNGHINLARALVQNGVVTDVIMVLSPLNPFKQESASALVSDTHRMAMLRLALEDVEGVIPSDIELSMPRPSYTIDTLDALSQLFPNRRFRLVIGSDNFAGLPRWKQAPLLMEKYTPIVYPRPGYPCNCAMKNLPMEDVSASQIRRMIAHGDDVKNLLPEKVLDYILQHNLYTPKN